MSVACYYHLILTVLMYFNIWLYSMILNFIWMIAQHLIKYYGICLMFQTKYCWSCTFKKNICSSYAMDKCCKKFTTYQKKHPRISHSTLINHQLQKNTKAKVVINNFYKKKVPLKFWNKYHQFLQKTSFL